MKITIWTARRSRLVALVGAGGLALAGCSAASTTAGPSGGPSGSASDAPAAAGGTVVLVTHDSFALSPELITAFEKDTGLTLKQVAPGDAGTLVNQLVLTKDAPIGDVVFGIDNSFASRAIDEGVLAPYTPADLPADAAKYEVDSSGSLTPIDTGDVCVNVDDAWFAAHQIPVPTTLQDLTKPEYKDLLVVENPATSSPGLAFLLGTVGAFGKDGWTDYWKALKANGVTVAASWSDAYYVDFSGPSSTGKHPLVVSYSSSPPDEIPQGASTPQTSAMLDTCFRQVEYAGVLAGAKNPEGAKKVVDWLLSPAVQADIPGSMWVYPVVPSVALPENWAKFAPQATKPFTVAPAEITKNRDAWITAWTDTVVG